MLLRKKIMITSLVVAAILFAIAIGAWWYLFFGKPNPPLQTTNISINGAGTNATSTISTAPASDTAAVINATPADAPGENPPLGTEAFSVDGAQFTVEVASSVLEQSRGLSFRPSLGANDGMLFIFSTGTVQTFWMKDMNFPLDMIWISGNTVVGFAQNAPAPTSGTQLWQLPIFSSPDKTDKVLEVDAGTVAKYNIKVGDTVTIGPAN
jgi:uncharacterized membrane protein (UPF0127 family)